MSQNERGNFALALQNSYGGYDGFVNPTSYYNVSSLEHMVILSHDVGLDIPPLYEESLAGKYDEGVTEDGPRMVAGTINFNAHPIDIGHLISYAFGAAATSVQSNNYYTHTFQPVVTDPHDLCASRPLTMLDYRDTGSAFLFYDIAGSAIEIAIANGDFAKINMEVAGGNFTRIANVSPTYIDGRRFKWDQTSISIDGTANLDIRDITIKLNNNVEAQHTNVPSPYPSRIKRTALRNVEVNGTVRFNNHTELDEFLNQSERELVLTMTGPAEAASGYNETLEITLPSFRYEEYKPVPTGPGPVELSFTGRGKYNSGSGTAIQITLVNTRAAYN